MRDSLTANHLERRRWIAKADYAVFVVTTTGIDEAMS